jgi:predicted acyl esterase
MLRSLRTVTLTGIAGILVSGSLSGQVRRDFFIPVPPADSLDATCYIPATPPPPAGYPVFLMVHGFGDTKEARLPSCNIYAASGYLTLAYTVRGHGKSSGGSSIMSDQERSDLAVVINFVKQLPQADSNAIGLIGGSQGGLHALWAAEDRLPVKALSADAITPSWASEMFVNGSVRRTVILLLQSPDVRYTAERDTLWTLLREDRYTQLRTRFCRDRDIDPRRLVSSERPLLQFLKWQDHYFSVQPGLNMFLQYAGPKKLYIGTQGHFSDEIEDERNFQNGQITRWFDYYLRGKNTGIREEPQFTRSVSSLPVDSAGSFRWTRSASAFWPPAAVQPLRLYLTGDRLLSPSPSGKRQKPAVLLNRYNDTNYTFREGYIEGFRGRR